MERKLQRLPIYSSPPQMHSLPHYQYLLQLDTLVTVDEHTPERRNHPKSILLNIRNLSWCCKFSGFGQMSNDVNPSFWYHTEYFLYPKNPFCSANSFLCPPKSMETTKFSEISTLSIVLPFPECHVASII